MNLRKKYWALSLLVSHFFSGMEKQAVPEKGLKEPRSYLQWLPPELWKELYLHIGEPGKIIDNRGDLVVQTHEMARKFCILAQEYMRLDIASNAKVNRDFLKASQACMQRLGPTYKSFYLPNEISLACALRLPGARRALKEELNRKMDAFQALSQEDKNTTLFDVMRNIPSRTIIRKLIAHGAHINARSPRSNFTPLRYGVESGRYKLVRTLLRLGAQTVIADSFHVTPLMRAVIKGNCDMTQSLARASTSVNSLNLFECSALYYAARSGNPQLVQILLNAKARVLMADQKHEKNVFVAAVESESLTVLDHLFAVEEPGVQTGFFYDSFLNIALKRAVELGNEAMVRRMFEKVKDLKAEYIPSFRPDHFFDDGLTSLTTAIAKNHTSIAIFLIDYARDRYLSTNKEARSLALAWAVAKLDDPHLQKSPEMLQQFNLIIEMLLEDDVCNPLGNVKSPSACFYAAHQGNIPLLTKLLEKASEHTRCGVERALHEAIKKLSVPAVQTLLSFRPALNWLDENNQTALIKAAHVVNHANLEIIDLLLQKGASCAVANTNKIMPLHVVMHNPDRIARLYCIEQFIKKNAPLDAKDHLENTALQTYCMKKNSTADVVHLLLQAGASVNEKDNHGNTALMYAVAAENEEVVRELLDNKADPNLTNNSGCGPLTKLARISNHRISGLSALLLNHGADFNKFKNAMLRQASKVGNTEFMNTLIALGANLNSVSSSYGNTPLHKAAKKSQVAAVRLLLKAGADITIANREGKTALEIAMELSHSAISSLLTEKN